MARRILILLFALWGYVALPGLCQSGLLAHACGSHESDGCGHESGCEDDPCAKITAVHARHVFRSNDSKLFQFPPSHLPTMSILTDMEGMQSVIGRVILHPFHERLPAPGSHLPLLI